MSSGYGQSCSTPDDWKDMARFLKSIALVVLLAVIAALIYRVYSKHGHDSVSVNLHRVPILIPGIQEPDELRVEPFPAYVPTEPERMLGEAMKQNQGINNPDALLPALNRILSKYPDYADGYPPARSARTTFTCLITAGRNHLVIRFVRTCHAWPTWHPAPTQLSSTVPRECILRMRCSPGIA